MSQLQRVQEKLVQRDIPAILLSDLNNVRWLTGFTGTFGYAIVTQSGATFVTDSRYVVQAKEQVLNMPSGAFGGPVKAIDFLRERLAELGVTKIAFEGQNVVVDTYNRWSSELQGTEWVATKSFMDSLRWTKSAEEVALIKKACAITDACYEHIVPLIKPGVSEQAIYDSILEFYKSRHSQPAFTPIVVSGEKSARPHGRAGEKLIESGDFITIDMGASVEGYPADMTRTFVAGKASDRHHEIYDMVRRCEAYGCSALTAGANGRDIDTKVREMMDEKDLSKHYGHGLGHGLGLLVHDPGRLSINEDQPIEVGQVWTVEPGIYIEGFGGVRIEDDVLVTKDGPEMLTFFTRDLLELG